MLEVASNESTEHLSCTMFGFAVTIKYNKKAVSCIDSHCELTISIIQLML